MPALRRMCLTAPSTTSPSDIGRSEMMPGLWLVTSRTRSGSADDAATTAPGRRSGRGGLGAPRRGQPAGAGGIRRRRRCGDRRDRREAVASPPGGRYAGGRRRVSSAGAPGGGPNPLTAPPAVGRCRALLPTPTSAHRRRGDVRPEKVPSADVSPDGVGRSATFVGRDLGPGAAASDRAGRRSGDGVLEGDLEPLHGFAVALLAPLRREPACPAGRDGPRGRGTTSGPRPTSAGPAGWRRW